MLEDKCGNIHALLEQEKSISFSLSECPSNEESLHFNNWRVTRQKLGSLLTDKAISHAAMHCDAVIIINPVKEVAFAHFLRPDTQSKKMTVRAKTSGYKDIVNTRMGFILAEDCTKELQTTPLEFKIGSKTFFSLRRQQGEHISSCIEKEDIQLSVCRYPTGPLVTADVDAIMIASSSCNTKSYWDSHFGEILAEEKNCMLLANRSFQQLIENYYPNQTPCHFELFTHGPANRSPISEQRHLHFPMTVYFPTGAIHKLGTEQSRSASITEFLNLFSLLKNQGRNSYLNSRWNLGN